MPPLLTQLQAYVPATLWTLASKQVIMQGAGLLATGDIVDLYWSGETQIVVEYPQRLGTLTLRLKLAGERIIGECDCSQAEPCQHYVASMMLTMHLLKDFAAFGRFPNRVLAAKLKTRLLLHTSDTSAVLAHVVPAKSEKKPGSERHVLIRPTAANLFTFRDSFSRKATDAFATLPLELRTFVGHWSSGKAAEDAFWKWFISPLRKLPVYVEIKGELKPANLGDCDGWQGAAALDITENKLLLRRILSCHDAAAEQPFIPIGAGLVYLMNDETLIQLPNLTGWHQWDRLFQVMRESMWSHGSYADPTFTAQVNAGAMSAEIPIGLLNETELVWWGDNETHRHELPALIWRGQSVDSPSSVQPWTQLSIMPSKHEDYLVVRLACKTSNHSFESILSRLLQADEEIARLTDPSLLNAKTRREAILATLHACWLEPDKARVRSLLKELGEAPVFRTAALAKTAVQAVKKYLAEYDKSLTAEALHASHQEGWLRVNNVLHKARTTVALARLVLGADLAEKNTATRHFTEVHSLDANHQITRSKVTLSKGDSVEDADDQQYSNTVLYVPTADAMSRLPELVAACQQQDVRLTYSRQPIEIASLVCSATAVRPEEEGIDWFEVKPEVICGGALIPQQQWEDILAKGHVIDANGSMKVIDVKSLDTLKRLTDILGSQRRESRAEAEEKKQQALDELVKIPRLRILDWLLLAKHGINMTMPPGERAVLESLLSFETLTHAPLPALKAKLRDYQVAGYSWLAFLYQHGFGGCLADDMGLGKTIQTITLLAAIREGLIKPLADDGEGPRPHLLVVPPTLLFNWENEIKTFCPDLPVHEYTGKGRSLIGIKDGVVITTYELARRDIEVLRDVHFDLVIFDEAQQIKNIIGERSRAMRQLIGRMKLTLTGTPLENHVGEYYSIIDLAVPGLFGDYRHFMDAMKQPNGHFNPLDRAKPFVLRRTKDKILKELPPKQESDMYLDLTEGQKRFYTRAVGEVKQEVLAAFQDKGAQQAGIVALAALTRLRQVCVSPGLLDPSHTEVSPKLSHLLEKLSELRAEGHCALVFSQFTKALDLLEKQLVATGLDFQRLDGSTPQQKRKTLVENFQKADGPGIFLISLKAGGAGLNLTRASYVFHLDPWWNPAAENQASDRAHRMGQKNTVFIQRLLMRHTVEEKIMLLKAQKRELFDRVLSGAEGERGSGGAIITKDDFKFLLE